MASRLYPFHPPQHSTDCTLLYIASSHPEFLGCLSSDCIRARPTFTSSSLEANPSRAHVTRPSAQSRKYAQAFMLKSRIYRRVPSIISVHGIPVRLKPNVCNSNHAGGGKVRGGTLCCSLPAARFCCRTLRNSLLCGSGVSNQPSARCLFPHSCHRPS